MRTRREPLCQPALSQWRILHVSWNYTPMFIDNDHPESGSPLKKLESSPGASGPSFALIIAGHDRFSIPARSI